MNERIPLTMAELQARAPSVFATTPVSDVSGRYTFVPTTRVVETLGKSGWLPVSAQQTRARSVDGLVYKKHLIRFGNAGLPEINGCAPEIILLNSHDTTSCFILVAGLFRYACLNGLLVADAMFSSFVVRHTGYRDNQIIDAERRIVREFPQINRRISEYQGISLRQPERLYLARHAAALRWPGEHMPVLPENLLTPRRPEDAGNDLWTVFNVVQENLLRGGVHGYTRTSRRMTTREIKSVNAHVSLNRDLWSLAETIRKRRIWIDREALFAD